MMHHCPRQLPGRVLLALALTLVSLLPAGAQRLEEKVVEHKLKNGMRFLFVERHQAPVFAGQVVFRVGGVDEQVGATGLAHMFEHMAFKGTRAIGTRSYAKEVPLLDAMERVAKAIVAERARGEAADPKRIAALQQKMKGVQEAHRKLVVSDEFSEIYDRNGGTHLNAFTGKDTTSYVVSLPANRLELWALMESQRIADPILREFYTERDVVAEERRTSEDDPNSKLREQLYAAAFTAHPYHFPIIGWMSDIQSLTATQARAFHKRYYLPGNAVGSLVGDIRTPQAIRMVEKYFGALPAGAPPPAVTTVEPPQEGERRVTVLTEAEPVIMIAYHKPAPPHYHDVVFDVIDGVLTSGRTSRLYTSLVKEKRIALGVGASYGPGYRFPNLWHIGAAPRAPHTTAELETAIYEELEKLKHEPVPARELEKVKNQMDASYVRGLASNEGLADQLADTEAVIGDWRYITRWRQMVARVTPAEVQRVARQYLTQSNRTVGTLVKKEGVAQ